MSDALWGQIITGVITLGLALIGYLKLRIGQKKVEVKVDTYAKEVDGMKTELVTAVQGRYQAEGELKGAADAKANADKTKTENPQKEVIAVTGKSAEKIATVVVETIKKDPDIEVKKTE